MLSRPGLGEYPGVSLPEVPCLRCEARVRGLGWGELCSECHRERSRRASRLSQRISLPVALLMALWVFLRVPDDPTARVYGGIAVLATYVIARRIVHVLAMEYLPR